MGHNVDLIQMMGLPEKIMCPRCKLLLDSNFDDYDIDCGEPNNGKGMWELDCYCDDCGNHWIYQFKVKIKEIN